MYQLRVAPFAIICILILGIATLAMFLARLSQETIIIATVIPLAWLIPFSIATAISNKQEKDREKEQENKQ